MHVQLFLWDELDDALPRGASYMTGKLTSVSHVGFLDITYDRHSHQTFYFKSVEDVKTLADVFSSAAADLLKKLEPKEEE